MLLGYWVSGRAFFHDVITFFVGNLVQQAMAYRYFRLHSVLKIFYQVDVLVLRGPA